VNGVLALDAVRGRAHDTNGNGVRCQGASLSRAYQHPFQTLALATLAFLELRSATRGADTIRGVAKTRTSRFIVLEG